MGGPAPAGQACSSLAGGSDHRRTAAAGAWTTRKRAVPAHLYISNTQSWQLVQAGTRSSAAAQACSSSGPDGSGAAVPQGSQPGVTTRLHASPPQQEPGCSGSSRCHSCGSRRRERRAQPFPGACTPVQLSTAALLSVTDVQACGTGDHQELARCGHLDLERWRRRVRHLQDALRWLPAGRQVPRGRLPCGLGGVWACLPPAVHHQVADLPNRAALPLLQACLGVQGCQHPGPQETRLKQCRGSHAVVLVPPQ